MSEHVVAVRLRLDNSEFAGLSRDEEATRKLQAAFKDTAAAARDSATASKTLSDAETASSRAAQASALAQKASSDAANSAARAKLTEAKAANADAIAAAELARAEQQLAAATANAQRAQATAEKTLRDNTNALKEQSEAINGVGSQLGSAVGMVKAFFAAWAVREGFGVLKTMVEDGIKFNSTLQSGQLLTAALIVNNLQLRDSTGRVVTEAEKFNAAMIVANQLQDQLKVKALQTGLPFESLNTTMRTILATAGAQVKSEEQLLELTTKLSKAGTVLGFDGVRMMQEVRSMMTGNRSELGIMLGLTQGDAKNLEKTGDLIDTLNKKLEVFQLTASKYRDTVPGALGALKNAWDQALGEGTQGQLGTVTRLFHDLTDQIVTFDKNGRAVFDQDFVQGIDALTKAFLGLASVIVGVVKKFDTVVDTMRAIKQVYTEMNPGTKFAEGMIAAMPGGVAGVYAVNKGRIDQLVAQYQEERKLQQALDDQAKLANTVGNHFTLSGKDDEKGLTDAQQHSLADFQRWMETFRTGAGLGGQDGISKQLLEIEGQRRQAIDKLAETEKKLHASNENWKKDAADINSTFDNKRDTALDTAFKKTGEFNDTMKQYAPSKDALDEANAKIAEQRATALQKLQEFKAAFGSLVMADWGALEQNINDHFDKASTDAVSKSMAKVDAETLKDARSTWELVQKIEIDAQTEAENQRIALIGNSIDRELAQRIAANEKWRDEEVVRINATAGAEAQKKAAIAVIDKALAAMDAKAVTDANKLRDAQVVGTEDWRKALEKVKEQGYVPIGEEIKKIIASNEGALANSFDALFEGIAKGQANLGNVLKSLEQDLSGGWAKMLSKMLSDSIVYGTPITTQLKQMWNSLGQGNMADQALSGAGFGGMLGGFFQKPGNEAGSGGAIGGAIGAVIGGILTSESGFWGAKVGAVIGSAIGTAVGASITKGTDHIAVTMQNVTAGMLNKGGTIVNGPNESLYNYAGGGEIDVSEKGISAEARQDLIVQVQRRVRETMKGWQNILDLFPEEVRKQLDALKQPELNLSGTFENGDITDQNALGSLDDILTNKLGKAAFSSYSDALRKGLELTGLDKGKIDEIFQHWGELQGKELQDAVGSYVTTLVTFLDTKKKVGANPLNILSDLHKGQLPGYNYSNLDDLNSQMALTTASLPKLDVEDQTTAMAHLNDLALQFYDAMTQALLKVDAIAKNMHDSFDNEREKIQLAGMSDQQKLNYYYSQLTQLRDQISHAKTDDEVNTLQAQFQKYVDAAFSLAPDNAQNRAQLLAALNDFEGVANTKLDNSRNEILSKQQKAADTLQTAADTLLKAANKLNPDKPDVPLPPGGTRPGPGPFHPTMKTGNVVEDPVATADDNFVAVLQSMQTDAAQVMREIGDSTTSELRAIGDSIIEQLRAIRKQDIAITGDGADFLRSVGFDFVTMSTQATKADIRNYPEEYGLRG